MKVNIDCGRSYIYADAETDKWINVDYFGKAPIGTSDDHQKGLCDTYQMPLDGQADEVLVSRIFEKLDDPSIEKLLADIYECLKPGGHLDLRVVDHDPAIAGWIKGRVTEHALFGPPANKCPRHITKYTKEKVISIVEDYGFAFIDDLTEWYENSIDYPCFVLKFIKKHKLAAKDYFHTDLCMALERSQCNLGSKILEIGPGNYPWQMATDFVDIDKPKLDKIQTTGRKIVVDLNHHRLPFADKEFDFVLASHVMEHTIGPDLVCREISRIAKAGVIISPSIYKETLFGFEETDHRWDLSIRASDTKDQLVFRSRKSDDVYKVMRDPDYQSILCGLFRTGRYDWRERRYLRNWFDKNEKHLDIFYYWHDFINVVIE